MCIQPLWQMISSCHASYRYIFHKWNERLSQINANLSLYYFSIFCKYSCKFGEVKYKFWQVKCHIPNDNINICCSWACTYCPACMDNHFCHCDRVSNRRSSGHMHSRNCGFDPSYRQADGSSGCDRRLRIWGYRTRYIPDVCQPSDILYHHRIRRHCHNFSTCIRRCISTQSR